MAHFELAFLYSTGFGGVVEKDERLAMARHWRMRGSKIAFNFRTSTFKGKVRAEIVSSERFILPAGEFKDRGTFDCAGDRERAKGFENFRLVRHEIAEEEVEKTEGCGHVLPVRRRFRELGRTKCSWTCVFVRGTERFGRELRRCGEIFRFGSCAKNVEAMSSLGHAYANGLGVMTQNNETALRWFKEAEKLGSPHASYGLAYMHFERFWGGKERARGGEGAFGVGKR